MEGLADNPGTLWLPGNRVSHYSTVHKPPAPVAQSEKLFSFKVFKVNMSKRDPFPSPKPETDATLSGFRPPQRDSFDKPTHIAQTEEPWSHLHSCATVASSQRGAAQGHGNSGDSLDFQLQAIYDHSKDFFWTKSQMLYQRESVSEGPRKQDKEKREEGEGIRMWVDPQRCSVYNIK